MRKLITVALIFILFVVSYLAYLGAFQEMKISERELGPYRVIYKKHQGAYSDTNDLFTEFSQWKLKQNLSSAHLMGVYYDDPAQIDESKLRSEIGLSLSETDYKRLSNIFASEFHFKQIPPRRYTMTTFPYKNMLSIFLGLGKAYPALNDYIKEKGYPDDVHNEQNGFTLEIYDETKSLITYLITTP